VGRTSKFTQSYLLEAQPLSFRDETLVLGFNPACAEHIPLLDNAANRTMLESKIRELGHPNARIKFSVSDSVAARPAVPEAGPSARPTPSPDTSSKGKTPRPVAETQPGVAAMTKEDFKNDPLIRKALEIFKGQIVEVRV
jgi:DNA polymerase-3 subunit gamma/tau